MVSMINKKYIKYLVIMFGMLVAALAFSILEILYLAEKDGNPARIISMLDYLVNAQNAIVTGINFYIFAVIIALGTILLTDNDYSYNTIIKYGRNKLYYRQIAKIILMALFFSSSFFLINLVISKGKSSVFYNWTEINSYLFYTKKYLVDINPYLLLILIWLQDFVYIVSAELLYLVLKWIIVVWLIFLVVERLTGRIIPVVNAATLHMDIVAQMFFIAVLLIGMKLLLLKRVINKRDF